MKKTYGLLGYPLGHSFSARFFAEKFAKEQIDAEYLNFETPEVEDYLPRLVEENRGLQGLNVTIPHKRAVIPLLQTLSEEAQEIGAVNVIKVHRDGVKVRLSGHNSDVVGFTESIRPLLRPHHRKALVLGTGGASLAVVYGLKKLGLYPQYVSRTSAPGRLTYSELTPEILAEFTVIVNCTPLGMYPKVEACPPLDYTALTPQHLLYDLVYNPEETLFLQRGKVQGAVVKNGLEMLHLQALESWRIWHED